MFTCFRFPSTLMVTFCTLGDHVRLVRFLERGLLCPNCGPLPQISHFATNLLLSDVESV